MAMHDQQKKNDNKKNFSAGASVIQHHWHRLVIQLDAESPGDSLTTGIGSMTFVGNAVTADSITAAEVVVIDLFIAAVAAAVILDWDKITSAIDVIKGFVMRSSRCCNR